jgi:hypothetical protein
MIYISRFTAACIEFFTSQLVVFESLEHNLREQSIILTSGRPIETVVPFIDKTVAVIGAPTETGAGASGCTGNPSTGILTPTERKHCSNSSVGSIGSAGSSASSTRSTRSIRRVKAIDFKALKMTLENATSR